MLANNEITGLRVQNVPAIDSQIMERYPINNSSLVIALDDRRIFAGSGECDILEADVFHPFAGVGLYFLL